MSPTSSSMLFRGTDPAYADKLLKHAKELYDFADKYRGFYHEAITMQLIITRHGVDIRMSLCGVFYGSRAGWVFF